jgi:sulfur carrier protein
MTLILNGQRHDHPTDQTALPSLITKLGFAPGQVLVEHNGTALFPREWETTHLADGDRLELIQVAAGG